jgi:hypothetical protein
MLVLLWLQFQGLDRQVADEKMFWRKAQSIV